MYQQIKTYLSNNKLLCVMILVALVAVSSALYNWYHPKTVTVSKTQYQTVTQEKVVEKIRRVIVPGPTKIVTIEKETIANTLDIHPIADNEQIIANADIPASDSGLSVIAVLDMETGESKIIAKEKPLSLFGFPSNIEAGVRYGVSTQTTQEGDIFARWQFLRVGKIFVGAYGEMTTRPEAKAMIETAFKW